MSDDAIITDAHFDGKLSGPVFSNISFRRAIEPLPDTGRTIMNDTSSSGIPIFERNGAHSPETASASPLAENIETAVIRMTSAGRSPMPECKPSFAPSRNAPGISLREKAQQSPKIASRAGIISSAKYVIVHPTAVFFRFADAPEKASARESAAAKTDRHDEQIQTVGRMSKGVVLPAALRSEIIVVGTRQGNAVPRTVKVIMSSVAVSLFPSESDLIAATASGVAALPTPRIFAAIAAEISDIPRRLFHASGKSGFRTGDITADNLSRKPSFSAHLITPLHRHIMPISDMVRVTAREHPDTAASESAVIFPLKRANKNEKAMIMPEILTAMK